jgi:predicted ArsR family transcriptional regulator
MKSISDRAASTATQPGSPADRDELLTPETPRPLGASRARVLDLLISAARPMEIKEMSSRTGLHPNTVRFHLDALVGSGLAARAPNAPRAPGRPSMTYRALADGSAIGQRRYQLLARMLASLVSGSLPDPAAAAEEAGREWGARMTTPAPAGQRVGAPQAAGQLAGIMDQAGFAPETVADGPHGFQIRLHRCPFLEVASQHSEIVCQLHLGLMTGALDQLRAPLATARLEPFAEPGMCVASLVAARPRRGPRPAGGVS